MTYGVNAPNGLQSRYTISSSTFNGQQNPFSIASGYATSLFAGDLVTFLGDGTIGICPAGTPAVGVLNNVYFTDALGNYTVQPYWPANQATQGSLPAVASVIIDPNALFDVQVSTSLDSLTMPAPTVLVTQVGLNANLAIGGGGNTLPIANPTSGSTRTGQSGYYLDATTIGSDSTLSVKIVGISPYIGNAAGVNFNNVLVTLNNQAFKSAGVGNNIDSRKITTLASGTAYTTLLSDEVIEVSITGTNAMAITLPAASAANKGKQYVIKDINNASTHNITIAVASGSFLVMGGMITISTQYGSATVMSDGSAWFAI